MRERTVVVRRTRCIRPGCKRAATRRGLCDSDYQQLWVLDRDGVLTFEDAERKGKCLPVYEDSVKGWFLAKV